MIYKKIVRSSVEPSKDSLWLREGIIYEFRANGWTPVGTGPIDKIIEVYNDELYIKGIGNYDGTNPESSESLQTVIKNLQTPVVKSKSK